jgi:hypothetical protein
MIDGLLERLEAAQAKTPAGRSMDDESPLS